MPKAAMAGAACRAHCRQWRSECSRCQGPAGKASATGSITGAGNSSVTSEADWHGGYTTQLNGGVAGSVATATTGAGLANAFATAYGGSGSLHGGSICSNIAASSIHGTGAQSLPNARRAGYCATSSTALASLLASKLRASMDVRPV